MALLLSVFSSFAGVAVSCAREETTNINAVIAAIAGAIRVFLKGMRCLR